MEPRVATPVLWLRALFAGSFAFFLGVAGHLMAAGLLPGTAFMVALYVFSVVISVPVLAQPASRVRMLGLLVGGQTFIHLCLTLTAGHVGDPKPLSTAPAARDLGFGQLPMVDGKRVGGLQDAWVGSNQMPRTTPTLPIHHLMADMSAHLPMMVAHLAAAAVVALWLAYGEKTVFTVLGLVGARLLRLVRRVLPVSLPLVKGPTAVAAEVAEDLRELLLGPTLSRRGPPLLAA